MFKKYFKISAISLWTAFLLMFAEDEIFVNIVFIVLGFSFAMLVAAIMDLYREFKEFKKNEEKTEKN